MNRDLRAIGLGFLVVALASVSLRGLPRGLAALRRTEEAVLQRAELLARSRREVASLPALDDSIDAFDRVAAGLARMLLVGEDAGTASADLMRRVRERFHTYAHLAILGFQPSAARAESGPLTLAAVTVTVEADFEELVAAIGSLERDSALAVESLDVRAADPHGDGPERLGAEIRVSGWYRERRESPTMDAETFAR